MQKSILLVAVAAVIIGLAVRAAFDPTHGCQQLAYSDFEQLVNQSPSSPKIERIYLQQGMQDFWGRNVILITLKDPSERRFVVGAGDFYRSVLGLTKGRNIRCENGCLDITPQVEVVVTLGAVLVLILAVRRRQPTSAE